MKTQDWLIVGAVGVGAYLLYTNMAGAMTSAPSSGTGQPGATGINAGQGPGWGQVSPWGGAYSGYGGQGSYQGGPGAYGAYQQGPQPQAVAGVRRQRIRVY